MTETAGKQAYLIMAHDNVKQLNLLLSALDSRYGDIFLHVDAKSRMRMGDLIKPRYAHLFICDSMKVYWADYTQVECELNLLQRAAAEGPYQYYHLLSGVDFPLMDQKRIHDFLDGRNELFIHYATRQNLERTSVFVQYYHFFQKRLTQANRDHRFSLWKVLEHASLFIQRLLRVDRLSGAPQMFKGANWFSIPDDFVRYVLSQRQWIRRQFRFTRSPDEFFLQTLAYNAHEFCSRIYCLAQDDDYNACLRYIDWQRGTPYVFTEHDYKELTDSGMLFARKFDLKNNPRILTMLMNSFDACSSFANQEANQ